jgi:hypothetical protein
MRNRKRIVVLIVFFGIIIFLFSACTSKEKKMETGEKSLPVLPALPEFNADSCYAFVKAQCDFGPRVPNTKAHIACGDYLIRRMKEWSNNVIVQSDVVTAFDGTKLRFRNIITSFNPESKRRILLFAHWDTRPWADQDTFDTDKPNLGADDGASGVGVLMEIARQLKLKNPDMGIDIAFFDAEDWGKEGGGPGSEDSYALGTQYWTKKTHVNSYNAEYGILLDMVGAKNAQFRKEGLSRQAAGFVIDKVWSIAQQLGYSSYFLYEDGGWVTDDHVYVNRMNIPAIDIINTLPGTAGGFAPHWHTHKDNMDVIDPNTLKAVGQTLIGTIYWQDVY